MSKSFEHVFFANFFFSTTYSVFCPVFPLFIFWFIVYTLHICSKLEIILLNKTERPHSFEQYYNYYDLKRQERRRSEFGVFTKFIFCCCCFLLLFFFIKPNRTILEFGECFFGIANRRLFQTWMGYKIWRLVAGWILLHDVCLYWIQRSVSRNEEVVVFVANWAQLWPWGARKSRISAYCKHSNGYGYGCVRPFIFVNFFFNVRLV